MSLSGHPIRTHTESQPVIDLFHWLQSSVKPSLSSHPRSSDWTLHPLKHSQQVLAAFSTSRRVKLSFTRAQKLWPPLSIYNEVPPHLQFSRVTCCWDAASIWLSDRNQYRLLPAIITLLTPSPLVFKTLRIVSLMCDVTNETDKSVLTQSLYEGLRLVNRYSCSYWVIKKRCFFALVQATLWL